MRSQPGKQTIVTHIFPNISGSKSNQPVKFGLLIEFNNGNTFLQKPCKNDAERLVPDLSFQIN